MYEQISITEQMKQIKETEKNKYKRYEKECQLLGMYGIEMDIKSAEYCFIDVMNEFLYSQYFESYYFNRLPVGHYLESLSKKRYDELEDEDKELIDKEISKIKDDRVDTYFDKYETRYPVTFPAMWRSINPIIKGEPKKDTNVANFRRFVFESDEDTLQCQLKGFEKIKQYITEVIYSGGKSYHVIVEFKQNVATTNEEYHFVWKKLCALFENLTSLYFDKATQNPSRLTRTPGVMRDNGVMQRLIWRNPFKVDYEIFGKDYFVYYPPKDKYISPKYITDPHQVEKMKLWAQEVLRGEASRGTRNSSIFRLSGYLQTRGSNINKFKDILIQNYPDMEKEILDICRRKA